MDIISFSNIQLNFINFYGCHDFIFPCIPSMFTFLFVVVYLFMILLVSVGYKNFVITLSKMFLLFPFPQVILRWYFFSLKILLYYLLLLVIAKKYVVDPIAILFYIALNSFREFLDFHILALKFFNQAVSKHRLVLYLYLSYIALCISFKFDISWLYFCVCVAIISSNCASLPYVLGPINLFSASLTITLKFLNMFLFCILYVFLSTTFQFTNSFFLIFYF